MSVRSIEAEVSIKSGVQAECTIGREVIVEVHEDVNLEPLTVTANGNYEPSEGVDGFSDVTVAVPERIPVTESLSVTENGTYEPDTGVDGYDRVTVSVPPTIPDIEPLTVTANGVYTAEGDGFNPVTVNVEAPKDPNVIEGEFIGAETGMLTIDTGYDGNSFIKRIEIQPLSGSIRTDDGFLDDAFAYAVNTLLCASFNVVEPSYDGTGSRNRLRVINFYKSGDAYTCAQESPYAYDADTAPSAGTANVIKIPSNHQLRLFVSDVRQGNSTVFATGIRYKYQVFY